MYFLTFVVQRYFICKTAKTNKNMNYNFDEVIDRRGTCSEKVDGMVNVWGKSDLIPMWVADMDFATPPLFWKPFASVANIRCWDIPSAVV